MGKKCSMYEGGERFVQGFGGKPEGKKHSEDLSVDGKIKLNWILKMWDREAWSGLIWVRIRTGVWHV
jgi:hypothetical protein